VSFIVYEVNWISMLSYLCLPAIWISALLFFTGWSYRQRQHMWQRAWSHSTSCSYCEFKFYELWHCQSTAVTVTIFGRWYGIYFTIFQVRIDDDLTYMICTHTMYDLPWMWLYYLFCQ
jgi:hypothetical protein